MTDIINQNAVNALKTGGNRSVLLGPLHDFSTTGSQSFTIGIVFKCVFSGSESVLMRQTGGFELGLQEGFPYFKGPGLKEETYKGEKVKAKENQWCAVHVTYDTLQRRLALYMNGIGAGDWENVDGDGNETVQPYLLGETLEGYVRYIRLYERCLPLEDIILEPFAEPKSEIGINLDFTQPEPLDKGRAKLKVLEMQGKQTALRTGVSGAATARNSGQIHKVIMSHPFTVMQKIYLKRGSNIQASTFTCGNMAFLFEEGSGQWDKETVKLRLFRDAGNTYTEISGTVLYEEWSVLTGVYDKEGKKALFYINGVLAGLCDFEMIELLAQGVCFGGQGPYIFPGVLGDTAVYSRMLTPKEIQDQANKMTMEEDSDLISYYSFSNGRALDLRNNMLIDVKAPFRLVDLSVEPSVLKVEEAGAAYPSPQYTQSGFENGFGILTRFCATEMQDASISIIYAHEEGNNQIRMGLYKRAGENHARLYFGFNNDNVMDAQLLELLPKIRFDEWQQYLVIYKKPSNEFVVYLNSDKVFQTAIVTSLSKNRSIAIGNSGKRNEPFRGQIEYVALFNSALSDISPGSFRNRIPSVGERGLYSLYTFNGKAREEKTGQEMILSEGAKLLPVLKEKKEEEGTYLVIKGSGTAVPKNPSEAALAMLDGRFSVVAKVYARKTDDYQSNILRITTEDRKYLIELYAKNRADGQELNLYIHGNCRSMGYQCAMLPYNQWSTICLSADFPDLSVFINGELKSTYQFSLRITALQEDSVKMYLGSVCSNSISAYIGRIQFISVFDRPLTEQEAVQYSVQIPLKDADGIVSLYNFSKGTAIEQISGQPIILNGEAAIEQGVGYGIPEQITQTTNLSYAFHAKGTGFGVDRNAAGMCRAMSGKSYSMFAKVLWRPKNSYKSVLMELPGAGGEESGFKVTLCMGERLYLSIQSGGISFTQVEIERDTLRFWMNIGFVYEGEGQTFFIYVNGKLQYKMTGLSQYDFMGEAYFANSANGKAAFEGFLESISVLDSSCEEQEVAEYCKGPLFLLQDGVASYYDFSIEKPVDLVSGREIQVSQDCKIVPCEDVQFQTDPLYLPELGEDMVYGTRTQWIAEAAFLIAVSIPGLVCQLKPRRGIIMEESSPENPGRFQGSVVRYLMKYIYTMPPVPQIISTYPDIVTSNIQDAFFLMKNGGLVFSVVKAFYPQYCPLLSDVWEWYLEQSGSEDVQNMLEEVAQGVADYIKSMSEPPTPLYSLSIHSVTFCHTPGDVSKSALGMREDVQYTPVVPEWKKDRNSEENPSRCVYVSDRAAKELYLLVEFSYESNDGIDKDITIKAKCKEGGILGDAQEVLTFQSDGIYQYKVCFPNHDIGLSKAGLYEADIIWSYQMDGVLLGEAVTHHRIYVIRHIPVSPWSIIKEKNLLTYGAINTNEKILEYYKEHIGNTREDPTLEEFAVYVTAWIWGSGLFIASQTGEGSFAAVNSKRELCFNRDKMDALLFGEPPRVPVTVSPLDCSLIIADCVRQEGFSDIGVGRITTGLAGFSIDLSELNGKVIPKRGDQWQHSIPLSLRAVKGVGQSYFAVPKPSPCHYAAVTPLSSYGQASNRRIFDGCYALYNEGKEMLCAGNYFTENNSSFTGSVNPGYYRESLCEPGSCCCSEPLGEWEFSKEIQLSTEGRADTQVTGGLVDVCTAKVGPAEGWMLEQIKVKGGEEPCCRLSLESLRRILVRTTVSLLSGSITGEVYSQRLNAVVNSLYTQMPMDKNSVDERILILYNQTLRTIEELEKAAVLQSDDWEGVAGLLALLFYQASSGPYNWAGGDPKWNALLDGGYNPSEWVFIKEKDNKFLVEGTSDLLKYPVHKEAVLYAPFDKYHPKKTGFYLTKDEDALSLNKLVEKGREWLTEDIFWFTTGTVTKEDGDDFPFLCVSSNKFSLPLRYKIQPYPADIYFKSINENVGWRQIF